jgi:hypothetical protein
MSYNSSCGTGSPPIIPELNQHVLQLKLRYIPLEILTPHDLQLYLPNTPLPFPMPYNSSCGTGSPPMIPELDQHVLQLKLWNRVTSKLDQHVLQLKLRNSHLLYSNVQQLKLWNRITSNDPGLDQHILQLKLRYIPLEILTSWPATLSAEYTTSIPHALQLKLWNRVTSKLDQHVLQLKLRYIPLEILTPHDLQLYLPNTPLPFPMSCNSSCGTGTIKLFVSYNLSCGTSTF